LVLNNAQELKMTTLTPNLELDDDAITALKALCKETRMKPSTAIQAAILAYRRMKANERYLGTGELDSSNDHPSEMKREIKKVIREKYEHLA
jgi:hypothetical protein